MPGITNLVMMKVADSIFYYAGSRSRSGSGLVCAGRSDQDPV
jgi:hypothetical protein